MRVNYSKHTQILKIDPVETVCVEGEAHTKNEQYSGGLDLRQIQVLGPDSGASAYGSLQPGREIVVKGENHLNVPELPALQPGQKRLANIFSDYGFHGTNAEVVPIEGAAKEARTDCPSGTISRTLGRIQAGKMVEILCCGDKPEHLAKLADWVPLKRLAEPEEVATAFLLHASTTASMIGHTLPVDGGFLAK